MKKYFNKVVLLLMICIASTVVIVLVNRDRQLNPGHALNSVVKLDTEAYKQTELAVPANKAANRTALVLYSPGDAQSEKYLKNIKIALKHMRFKETVIPIDRNDTVSFGEYALIIIASSDNDKLETTTERFIRYVRGGGKMFWGFAPESTEAQFRSIYRRLGIVDYGDFVEYDGMSFSKELLPGITGASINNDFSDSGLQVRLDDRADIYAYAKHGGMKNPLIWHYKLDEGDIAVFNGTCIADDFWRGLIAGCISSLFDDNMYPIVNAMCIFLDDFPSPQYDSDNDIVRRTYNRTAREFYRDIWWPDMLSLAKRHGDKYTGLFVATYNDIVAPKDFEYSYDEMEQYFGNSLLKNAYEMGVHGYNHQSLTLAGGTPESFGYKSWASVKDMKAATDELMKIAKQLFPFTTLRAYIPPSNYLSPEGRKAVVAAIPELKVISGIYTNEGEEGSVYVQDFVIADDGIAEFPRITSGMLPEDFDRMSYICAMGMYGVFSHFVHPDDIFDEDRGKGQTWNSMLSRYAELIGDVHRRYGFLRSMTASDAADALKVYNDVSPNIIYKDDGITGSLENFYGEAFFYLKTDKKPMSVDEGCVVTAISTNTNGVRYYLVDVNEPNFTIKLVTP